MNTAKCELVIVNNSVAKRTVKKINIKYGILEDPDEETQFAGL